MKEAMETFYKLANPDGWDFYTGKTINYRDSIGKEVYCPVVGEGVLCSDTVIHASRQPNDCFVGSRIPCSAYEVKGIPLVEEDNKAGFRSLFVVREIEGLDQLFGWNYTEVCNPIHPFQINPPSVSEGIISLLKEWGSVRDSVGASVRVSVWDSVRVSVRDSVGASVRVSVWDSIWDSIWDSVRVSVRDSVGASVRVSVWDSIGAYVGSLFPNIEKWKYVNHQKGVYPFSSAAELWRMGFVPSLDGNLWRLNGGKKVKVLWEGKL